MNSGNQILTFQFEAARVCGMDRPYYVKHLALEHPGVCFLTLHERFGGAVVSVGPEGIQGWKTDEGFTVGAAPDFTTESDLPEGFPVDGWGFAADGAMRSDQTGGMCMVDVIEFDNGLVLSLTEECGLIWPSLAAYDNGDEDDCLCMAWFV